MHLGDRGLLVGHDAHDDRHRVEAGQAGGAEATVAEDDLVVEVAVGVQFLGLHPRDDGLHDALGLDALGELLQLVLGVRLARIERALVQRRQRDLADFVHGHPFEKVLVRSPLME